MLASRESLSAGGLHSTAPSEALEELDAECLSVNQSYTLMLISRYSGNFRLSEAEEAL